ncbi:unnamed protein product [Withania somnifera]
MRLFGRKFKASKVTTLANLAISWSSVLKYQHQVRFSLARSEVTHLLHLDRQEDPLHRVKLVIKKQNTVDALTMMKKYCHLLIEKRVFIKTKGKCPDELVEAISSLIFAASRWGEFPELHELREIFTSKYGNVLKVASLEPHMIPKLSKRQTGSGNRRHVLNDIAADCGITLCVEDETSQMPQPTPEVNSENECAKGAKAASFIKLEGS